MLAPAPHLDLFLTHFHWDHIQGLPFFIPLGDPTARIRIHAQPQGDVGTEELIAGQMRSPYFPVPLRDVSARIECSDLDGKPWIDGDLTVTSFRVRHPGNTCGFRVDVDGAAIVYIPDNEPTGEGYPLQASWEEEFVEFVRGADLLLHDSMYTTEEYERHRGWGHGTFQQAIQLANTAGVRRLLLFHHAPERTDTELDAIVAELRRDLLEADHPLEVEAACERRVIEVQGSGIRGIGNRD